MKKLFAIMLSLMLAAVLFAGCGGEKSSSTTSTTSSTPNPTTSLPGEPTSVTPTTSLSGAPTSATPTTSVTNTTSPTPSTSASTTPASSTPATSANPLADVLSKATAIANFYCEVTVTTPDNVVQTMKQWVKGDKMRMEMTTSEGAVIIIFNGTDMYMYDVETKTAIKFSAAASEEYTSALDDTEALEDYNPTLIGSETLDGKDCYVFQYIDQGVTTKMWIWKLHGLPIKVTLTDSTGTTTMLYKNISFDVIADSQFQLPADAVIMTIPGM